MKIFAIILKRRRFPATIIKDKSSLIRPQWERNKNKTFFLNSGFRENLQKMSYIIEKIKWQTDFW